MATTDKKSGVEIELLIAQALKNINALSEEFKKLSSETTAGMQDATGAINELESKAKSATDSVSKITKENTGAFNGMTAAAGGVALGLLALGKNAVESAGRMETVSASFKTMLGSADQADKLMKQLSDFGAETPFEFPELAQASRSLLAFGISADEILPKLKAIGDVSSGVNAPIGDIAEIFGKAKVSGTLFAEDINQLVGRGIPVIQEFAKQLGVSEGQVKKMASEGKITFPMLDKAFKDLTASGGKFAGMMDAQSQTFEGMMSTLQDNLGAFLVQIGTPIMKALKPLVGLMTEFANSPVLKSLAVGIAAVSGAWALYTLATSAATIATAKAVLAFVASPVGAYTIAITAAVSALYFLVTANDEAIQSIREWSPVLANFIGAFQEGLKIIDEFIASEERLNKMSLERAQAAEEERSAALIQPYLNQIDAAKKAGKQIDLEQLRQASYYDNLSGAQFKKIEDYYAKVYKVAEKAETDVAKEREKAYRAAVALLKRQEEIAVLNARLAGSSEADIFSIQQGFLQKRLEAARKFAQDETDIKHEAEVTRLRNSIQMAQQQAAITKILQESTTRQIDDEARARQRLIDADKTRIEYALKFNDLANANAPIKALETQIELENALAEIEQTRIRAKIEQTQKLQDAERERIAAEIAAEADPVKRAELQKKLQDDQIERAQEIAELESNLSDDRFKSEQDRIFAVMRLEELRRKQAFAMANAAIGDLQTLFGQQKSLAYAQALINSYESYTTTGKAYPFPLNVALGALSLAANLKQAAMIKETEPQPLAMGAILNRPTFSMDGRFVAGEAGREAVTPLNQLPGLIADTVRIALVGNQSKLNPPRAERLDGRVDAVLKLDTAKKAEQALRLRRSRSSI